MGMDSYLIVFGEKRGYGEHISRWISKDQPIDFDMIVIE